MLPMGELTATIQHRDDWWIGWIEEVPGVNFQERTYEALLESLRHALHEALEFNRTDARAHAGEGYREEKITI